MKYHRHNCLNKFKHSLTTRKNLWYSVSTRVVEFQPLFEEVLGNKNTFISRDLHKIGTVAHHSGITDLLSTKCGIIPPSLTRRRDRNFLYPSLACMDFLSKLFSFGIIIMATSCIGEGYPSHVREHSWSTERLLMKN